MGSQEAKTLGQEVEISCPDCRKLRALPLSRFQKPEGIYLVKCSCGHKFSLFFEKRKFFRKKTSLHGSLLQKGSRIDHPVTIVDLSKNGLCFTKIDCLQIEVGDEILIKFNLDTPYRPEITCRGIVRNIRDEHVGVELLAIDRNKSDLGFYLM